MTNSEKVKFVYGQILNLHLELALLRGLEREGWEDIQHASRAIGIGMLLSKMAEALQRQFQLRIRRLLDRARVGGNENVSLANLLEDAESDDTPDATKEQLRGLLAELRERAQPVVEATHKIIAHNDTVTIQRNELLGKMPGDTYEQLVADMYEWIRLAGVQAPYGTGTMRGHPVDMETLRTLHWETYRKDGETQAAILRGLLADAAHG